MSEGRLTYEIALSTIIHIFIVVAFALSAKLFPSEKILFEESVRVDLVALPDKITPRPKPKPVKKAPPIKKPKPKPKPSPMKPVFSPNSKKTQNDALQKLKSLAALDKLKSLKDPQPVAKPKKIEYKGNILKAGTALKGVDRFDHNKYLAKVKKRVHSHWYLPQWLTDKGLKALVRIKINPSGQLLIKLLEESSGNDEFDKLVLSTVEQSVPYPRPPQKFKDILAVDGMLLAFPE